MPRLALVVLLAIRCAPGADVPVPRDAPSYTAASVVNAADNQSGILAPNAIGTIYGVNLAYSTAGLTAGDVQGGVLPIVLGSSETMVFVDNIAADLYYVSPTQINFLVPPNLLPVPVSVYVTVDGLAGPPIPLTLAPAAPALFQLDAQTAIATLANGSLLTSNSPAQPGDIVVLYATGLGATFPPVPYGQLPAAAAALAPGANLQILLDGVAVPSSAIEYAGLAPGNAGLYQVNFTLPSSTGANPEIRLVMGSATSISGVHLPVSP
ncbi:MAG TPA: hypothetical protein VME17_07065 [Bryobacteraceae bacterium]|nr:hypothetical protein [Bryobacteraceae bacterium]